MAKSPPPSKTVVPIKRRKYAALPTRHTVAMVSAKSYSSHPRHHNSEVVKKLCYIFKKIIFILPTIFILQTILFTYFHSHKCCCMKGYSSHKCVMKTSIKSFVSTIL